MPAQAQIVQLVEFWTMAKDVVVDPLDRARNREPAAGEHQDIAPQPRPNQLMQRGARTEQSARKVNFMTHQGDKRGVDFARTQLIGGVAESRDILARQIDPPFTQVNRDILPEVGQLQSGADVIRELLALRVAEAEKVEHQTPNRVGRITRVADQVFDSLEALEIDV